MSRLNESHPPSITRMTTALKREVECVAASLVSPVAAPCRRTVLVSAFMLVAWNSADAMSSCCATTRAAPAPPRALYSLYASAITFEALVLRRPEVSRRSSSAMTVAAEELSSGTSASEPSDQSMDG
jgi:hypothetical protein